MDNLESPLDRSMTSEDGFVQLGPGDSLQRSISNFSNIIATPTPSDGGSIVAEAETGPSDSDLLRILECPVCNEFPAPPIYNCANGHFTCNNCIRALNNCSLCQANFTQVRNYALESIIEKTKFKCRNSTQGCLESVAGSDYSEHLEKCQYGPLVCDEKYSTVCDGVTVQADEYLEHLFSLHEACGKCIPSTEARLTGTFEQKKDESYPPIYLSEANGLAFILKTIKYKSFICWWVSCIDPAEAPNYKAVITWTKKKPAAEGTNSDGDNYRIKWSLPVHPLKTPFNEIRDSGLCAVLPETHVAPFATVLEPGSEAREDVAWRIRLEIKHTGEMKVPAIPPTPVKTDLPLQKVVEYLQYYFPLIAISFMVLALCLLSGIYLKTTGDIANGTSDKVGDYGSGSGVGSDLDMDYYGYRGFYYHGNEPRNKDPEGNEPSSGVEGRERSDEYRKMNERYRKNKWNEQGRDQDSNDDFVAYRGFYHQKDGKRYAEEDKHESNPTDRQKTEENRPLTAQALLVKVLGKLQTFVSYRLGEFFGVKNRLDKTVNKLHEKKTTKADEPDFLGAVFAKIFMVLFGIFSVIFVMISLAMYKRWLLTNPTGENQNRSENIFNAQRNDNPWAGGARSRRNRSQNQNQPGDENDLNNEDDNASSIGARNRPRGRAPRDRNMFRGPINRFRGFEGIF